MRHRWSPVLVVVAALALGAAGCGSLDAEKVEQSIRTKLDERLQSAGSKGRVRAITCPEDRPLKQGDTFTCKARFSDASEATVDVRQISDDGDVRWEVRRGG